MIHLATSGIPESSVLLSQSSTGFECDLLISQSSASAHWIGIRLSSKFLYSEVVL